MITSFMNAVIGFLPVAAFAALALLAVILIGSAITDHVRDRRRAADVGYQIDQAHRAARRAMNDAARQSWRNIIE